MSSSSVIQSFSSLAISSISLYFIFLPIFSFIFSLWFSSSSVLFRMFYFSLSKRAFSSSSLFSKVFNSCCFFINYFSISSIVEFVDEKNFPWQPFPSVFSEFCFRLNIFCSFSVMEFIFSRIYSFTPLNFSSNCQGRSLTLSKPYFSIKLVKSPSDRFFRISSMFFFISSFSF